MAQGKPKLPQFVVGEVRQNSKVNIILSKQLCVLSEAELFEPLGQIVHSNSSHQ
jgi:hypothetical protein